MKRKLQTLASILAIGFFMFLAFGSDDEDSSEETNSSNLEKSTSGIEETKPQLTDSIWTSLVGDDFRVTSDDFSDNEFYYHKKTPKYTNRNWVYTYIGKNNTSVWLRFRAQYYADDWLFIENIKFNIDGEIVEFPVGYGTFKRDNDGGKIWEWADLSVQEPSTIAILDRIANSKMTKVRYVGSQYHNDRVLTGNEKTALKRTLELYRSSREYR